MMFGEIKDLISKYDWALILYDKPEAANEACREMNGIFIDDCQVSVTMAQKRNQSVSIHTRPKVNPLFPEEDEDNFVPPPLGKRNYGDTDMPQFCKATDSY
jgi:hypothetical protein